MMRETLKCILLKRNFASKSTLQLVFRADHKFVASPGQALYMVLGTEQRPYSIASLDDNGEFTLYIKLVNNGTASRMLLKLQPDDVVEFYKPDNKSNRFGLSEPTVCVGLGTGVVPLYAIVEDALKRNFIDSIIFIYAAHTSQDLIYIDKLRELEKGFKNFTLNIFTRDSGSASVRSLVREQVVHYAAQDVDQLFLISSRESIAKSLSITLQDIGVDKRSIRILR